MGIEFHRYHLFNRLLFDHTATGTLCVPGSFEKNQLTLNTWISFWALYFVLLIDVSILMLKPCCFDYNSLVKFFEIRQCEPLNFAHFTQDNFGYLRSFIVHTKLKIVIFNVFFYEYTSEIKLVGWNWPWHGGCLYHRHSGRLYILLLCLPMNQHTLWDLCLA